MNLEAKQPKITKALVLAAGNGSRLIDNNPKPLYNLLGLPLLARTLFALEKAHITDAYIVLGYEADKIRATIEKNRRLKINLHWLENEDWQKPNGLSVLAAEDVLSEPFILAMCDHIFDPEILSLLQAEEEDTESIRLLVDYDVENVFDLADATKVKVKDGRVKNIAKDLDDFNAVDTGFFLADPQLFAALNQTCRKGHYSLSEGVQIMADLGKVKAVDIQGHLWHDIDTQAHAREGKKKLLASLGKPDDGIASRRFNRPISQAASRLLSKTPITPNQVTLLNLALGLAAAYVASLGGYLPFLIAAILFQLNSIFDGTDGELARLKYRTSRYGQWFDTIADNIVYVTMIAGYAVGVKKTTLPVFYFYAGIGGVLFGIFAFLGLYIYMLRNKKKGSLLEIKFGYEGWNKHFRNIIYNLGKRDIWALCFVLLALCGGAHLAFIYMLIFCFIMFLLALKLNFFPPRRSSEKKQEMSYSLD